MPFDHPLPRETALLARLAALPRRTLAHLGTIFPRNPAVQAVVSHATSDATPEEVWRRIMFYEEVPHRPPRLLRMLLPVPLRTTKTGLAAGAVVRCIYTGGGHLVKRITEARPPSVVRFEVVEQELGIEQCLTTVAGSYEIRAADCGSSIALTTMYRGHLRPRWLWRPCEAFFAHQLHRHILHGMGARTQASDT